MRAIGSASSSSSALVSRLDRHQGNQLRRIQKGVGDGSLTSDEAKGLMAKQARIEEARGRAMADGSIDKKEFKQLRRMQRNASRDIFEQRHNGSKGCAAPDTQGRCGTSQTPSGTQGNSASGGSTTSGQSGSSASGGTTTSGQSGSSASGGTTTSGQSGSSASGGTTTSGQSGTSASGGSTASGSQGTCDGGFHAHPGTQGSGTSGGSIAPDSKATCVDTHQGNQRNRILNGLRDGSINAGEAGGLLDQQTRIAESKGRAMADGTMDAAEYDQLRQLQREASLSIFNARHNCGIRV